VLRKFNNQNAEGFFCNNPSPVPIKTGYKKALLMVINSLFTGLYTKNQDKIKSLLFGSRD
jgi:hypothetical protein